ncbi:MAG: PadR family transcriptional regulator [Clostridiaceae bacterium]|nr:PadR family transcriptional regulator [Clostridiaceae bacterium]
MNKNNFSSMSETAYYILLSLTKERHGYGIMQHVFEITKGRIKLGPGTMYGTLSKLEKASLIKMMGEEDKRKYYKITIEGMELLKSEIERLKELYINGKEVLLDGEKG